ncbi:MAG: hypothetical protein L0H84_22045 [Pseudonocardia sp.]|nr:hypothetical protein [Pseudonocardia sp.]
MDGRWTDPASTPRRSAGLSSWDAMAPFGAGGVYVNFAGPDAETDRATVYGRSAERLDRVCAAGNTEGLFAAAARRP